MTATPSPPAPQGESSNWPVPTPPAAADTVSMAYPPTPSAPKAEQVPQDANLGKTVANMTRHAEHHIEQRDQQAPFTPSQRQEIRHKVEVEITALIVAERERHSAELRRELEGEREHVRGYVAKLNRPLWEEFHAKGSSPAGWRCLVYNAIAETQQQLAALQRENDELKGKS